MKEFENEKKNMRVGKEGCTCSGCHGRCFYDHNHGFGR
jgi:hypothetical protein